MNKYENAGYYDAMSRLNLKQATVNEVLEEADNLVKHDDGFWTAQGMFQAVIEYQKNHVENAGYYDAMSRLNLKQATVNEVLEEAYNLMEFDDGFWTAQGIFQAVTDYLKNERGEAAGE